MLSEKFTGSDSHEHAKILVKHEHKQKHYLTIPAWYLEENELEFNSETIILNELENEYLLIDASNNGVWVPKEMTWLEKTEFKD
ncbi:MAG: hypothetical protein ACLFMM_07890 [Methanohalobium sp.]|uniref:hypothetical protein n=1 Tax=Methanohalobium sp. TaxID=2837493 RepID=UPI00397BCA66